MKNKYTASILGAIAIAGFAATFAISGCGKPNYITQTFTESPQIGGALVIKPKVDIVMFEDASPSMIGPIETIKQQFPAFMTGISNDWDYNFTAIPIMHDLNKATPNVTQIVSNSSSGIQYKTPLNFTGFLDKDSLVTGTGSNEYGFKTIEGVLKGDTNGFLREDALLAVVMVSTGNDSETAIPQAGGFDKVDTTKLNAYKQAFISIKKVDKLFKFYPVVSTRNGNNDCLGGKAFGGASYLAMAKEFSTESYDICSQNMTSVLDAIKKNLKETIIDYIFDYIVLAEEPNLDSVKITKDGAIIPKDPTNGWSYEGYKQNVYTVNYPVKASMRTGYVFKLNGTAKYTGKSNISIDYQRAK